MYLTSASATQNTRRTGMQGCQNYVQHPRTLFRGMAASPSLIVCLYLAYCRLLQEALLSQRGRAMLRVCIASIQNVERSLLLLVVSASNIPLRTIKFFSVLFGVLDYWSMLQAITNKHSMVRRRLCDLHCMVVRNCFCHFVVRGRLCHILSFVVGKMFLALRTSTVQQSSIASY